MAASSRQEITQRWVARHLPARPPRAHKGDFGRVLVLAGSIDYPGAAVLTALGAMRAGAGVVRVATAESVAARLASDPGVLFVHGIAGEDAAIGVRVFEELRPVPDLDGLQSRDAGADQLPPAREAGHQVRLD